MLQLLLQSPIKGLHTQAPSKAKTLSHTYIHPGDGTGGLNVGADGFTASIDGCLEREREKETQDRSD